MVGGGHKRAIACQVSNEDADKIIQEMLQVINNGGGIRPISQLALSVS